MTVLLSASAIIAGIIAYSNLPIAALPSYDSPTISVRASLPGASPEIMASSVATKLEREFAIISGLEVISSISTLSNTRITLEFEQDRDIDNASIDVQAALLRAQKTLPIEMTSPPSYRKINPAESSILYLALSSPSMSLSKLNDFAENFVSPAISNLPGVAQIGIYGQKKYAVRVQVNPNALAARNLSMDDIATALNNANPNSPIGTLDGPRQSLTIQANRQLSNADDFSNIVVAISPVGGPVRLSDVANVMDSIESVRTASWTNNDRSITLAVKRLPGGNTVETVNAIRASLPGLIAQMPQSVDLKITGDYSTSIRDAIHDAQLTLLITIALVVLIIFLFLRKATATIIPVLSLPISLLSATALMYIFDYSLDNISLLAITLAVGLVVDDSIVVLENIVRHIEKGESPLQAAIQGSKEVSFTIISISLSLVAVFIPIFFMPGVIGLLFHEFAAVVGIAVLMSAVVSLTIIPMMASRYLNQQDSEYKSMQLTGWFAKGFNKILSLYEHTLDWALFHKRVTLGVAIATFFATGALFVVLPKGFFPEEDIGRIRVSVETVEDISFPAMSKLLQQTNQMMLSHPAVKTIVSYADDTNNATLYIQLKPLGERQPMERILEDLRNKVQVIPGIKVYLNPLQNLRLGGRRSKSRYQYVMRSVHTENLNEAATGIMSLMVKDKDIFRDVTSDAQLKGLQARMNINRDKANLLGVEIADIRSALYSAFGERQVSTIYTSSNSYQVIMQVADEHRIDESNLGKIYVRSKNDSLVPLSTVASVEREAGPISINHAGQLEAQTISFNLVAGASLGEATNQIELFKNELNIPAGILTSYAGDAAAFQSSQTSQIFLIVAALLVIYVLLGVLYESYIHPITILSGLPSAAVGALAMLWIFNMELSIIAMIGILMLIGIVKKNAIMMIDFALDAQRNSNMQPYEAIRTACLLRFRPIMMTTLVALMGAIPIAIGLGAGAELRQPLGLAVVGGLIFSQLITLFITPVIYLYLDRFSKSSPIQ
jgi:HAE1 family hydrophobic/amphiphilic exporter-1